MKVQIHEKSFSKRTTYIIFGKSHSPYIQGERELVYKNQTVYRKDFLLYTKGVLLT